VTEENKLLGSLTDGDVRRGFLRNLTLESHVDDFIQPAPKYIRKGLYDINQIIEYRKSGFRILPVLNDNDEIINVINFRFLKSYLPLDAILMAGGQGHRLKPLTNETPKPLLKVGDKPIIEHNIDRLISYGVDDFWISVRYKAEQIIDYFENGEKKGVSIDYIREKNPLGTIGAVRNVENLKHDYLLVSNSDILTDLDYEDFFLDFLDKEADISVLSIPYNVDIPYAVLETSNGLIHSFKEKPTYTYYSNGGIYLMRSNIIKHIPENLHYNATNLLELLIKKGKKVVTYPSRGYWLDIGKHDDYIKAQEDIKHIDL
jgi:NDP-sugar pyrophosphorylase family protein